LIKNIILVDFFPGLGLKNMVFSRLVDQCVLFIFF